MAYSPEVSQLCAIKSNQVALAVVLSATGGMNNGQLAILEGSLKAETEASVDVDFEFAFNPLGVLNLTSELTSSRTEVIADYEEPFGSLFGDAVETAERYAEIAFNFDIYFNSIDEAIDQIIDNFREAEKYVDQRIGIFI